VPRVENRRGYSIRPAPPSIGWTGRRPLVPHRVALLLLLPARARTHDARSQARTHARTHARGARMREGSGNQIPSGEDPETEARGGSARSWGTRGGEGKTGWTAREHHADRGSRVGAGGWECDSVWEGWGKITTHEGATAPEGGSAARVVGADRRARGGDERLPHLLPCLTNPPPLSSPPADYHYHYSYSRSGATDSSVSEPPLRSACCARSSPRRPVCFSTFLLSYFFFLFLTYRFVPARGRFLCSLYATRGLRERYLV